MLLWRCRWAHPCIHTATVKHVWLSLNLSCKYLCKRGLYCGELLGIRMSVHMCACMLFLYPTPFTRCWNAHAISWLFQGPILIITQGSQLFLVFPFQHAVDLHNECVCLCGHPCPPLLTGLWREQVSWHGATRRPAWRSTRWCRTGWMRSCSGSSWPRSETGCPGSSYGSEPPRTLCGATGGLTWGRQREGRGLKNTAEKLKWNLDWIWLCSSQSFKSGEVITMGN